MPNEMIDRDTPDTSLDLSTLPSILGPSQMIDVDPEKELARFQAWADLTQKLVAASVKATRPQDWVKMGDKVYLQGTGAERVAALWGVVLGEAKVVRMDHDDGHYEFIVTGAAISRRTGFCIQSVHGGRSSRDKFFWPKTKTDEHGRLRVVDDDGNLAEAFDARRHVDASDLRKAAVTNWQTRAVAMLAGLRGLTAEDLRAAGIEGVAEVQFEKGKRGGETVAADVKAARVKLGNEILAAVGGDVEGAKRLIKDLTKGDKPGKDGKVFGGFDTLAKLTKDWQVERAQKNFQAWLAARPKSGDQASVDDEAEF